jgi:hypothetical protein
LNFRKYRKFKLNTIKSLLIILYRYQADYISREPPTSQAQALALERDEDDLDIYLEEEENEADELTTYLAERRANRTVSY